MCLAWHVGVGPYPECHDVQWNGNHCIKYWFTSDSNLLNYILKAYIV